MAVVGAAGPVLEALERAARAAGLETERRDAFPPAGEWGALVAAAVEPGAAGDATGLARAVEEAGLGLVVADPPPAEGGGAAAHPLAALSPLRSVPRAERDPSPVLAAVVVDVSGSMRGEKARAARATAARVARNPRDGDAYALLAFTGLARWVVPPTPVGPGRGALEEAALRLGEGGGTDLARALGAALGPHTGRRKVVVLVSDGLAATPGAEDVVLTAPGDPEDFVGTARVEAWDAAGIGRALPAAPDPGAGPGRLRVRVEAPEGVRGIEARWTVGGSLRRARIRVTFEAAPPSSGERPGLPPDRAFLAALAREGGGALDPQPGDPHRATPGGRRIPLDRPLWALAGLVMAGAALARGRGRDSGEAAAAPARARVQTRTTRGRSG